MTIPSVLGKLRALLAADSAVNSRTSGRVYYGRLPDSLVSQMPKSAVLLTLAPGTADPYVPLHHYIVQVNCYGERRTTHGEEVDAYLLVNEVYEALHGKQAFVEGNAKFGSILVAAGPWQARDPDLNDVPLQIVLLDVYAATVATV